MRICEPFPYAAKVDVSEPPAGMLIESIVPMTLDPFHTLICDPVMVTFPVLRTVMLAASVGSVSAAKARRTASIRIGTPR